ncbi:MAG: MFS transporter [Bacillaceae bacterium]|nr:MFS transporter [Bacillaceae bacterium]
MSMKKGQYVELLAQRNYVIVLAANTFTTFGFVLFQIAFFWLAYDLTDSAFIAGLVILGATSPYIVFGLIGGAYADRWNRKKVVMYSNGLTAVVTIIVPILNWLGLLSVWFLALSAFAIVSLRCFFSPAIRAMVPQVLPSEQWPSGNSVFQIGAQLSKAIGPALGGFFIAWISAMSIYILFFILLVLSVVSIYSLELTQKHPEDHKGIFNEIIETFHFMRKIKPLFWSIMLFGLVLLFLTGIERIGLPKISDHVWNLGPKGFGLIMTMMGIGNIAGAVWLGKIQIKSYEKYIFIGWMLWGLFIALAGLSPWFYMAALMALLAGIAEAMNDLPMVLMIQRLTPEEQMGKVFSAWSTIAFVGETGSSVLAGALIGFFGVYTGFITMGSALIVIGLVGLVLTKEYYVSLGEHVQDETG